MEEFDLKFPGLKNHTWLGRKERSQVSKEVKIFIASLIDRTEQKIVREQGNYWSDRLVKTIEYLERRMFVKSEVDKVLKEYRETKKHTKADD